MRITVFTIYIIQKKRTSAPSVPRFFKLFSVPFKSMIQLLWVLLLILYINILIIKSIFNGTFGTICIYADSVRVFSGPPEKDLLVRIFSSFPCKPLPPRAFQRTSPVWRFGTLFAVNGFFSHNSG